MVVKLRFLTTAGALGAAITVSVAAPVQAQWAPKDPPTQYVIGAGPNAKRSWNPYAAVCATAAELDCLESVEAYIKGSWVKGTATGRTGNEPNGSIGSNEFKIPGLVNEDGKDLVEVQNGINYTGNVFHQVNVFASSRDFFKMPWESGRTDCIDMIKVNGKCMREGHLQRGVKFRVVTRSSWVLPTHISTKLSEQKTTVEKLDVSGATRVTIEGIPTYFMGVSDDAELTKSDGRGSWGILQFSSTVSDGRFYPIKKDCIEKPTMTIADNAYGHAVPSFTNNQLDLKLEAPHFQPDGKTEHVGVYDAIIPLETATCLWGTSIRSASQLTVEVIEGTGGVTRTATTSVNVSGDNLTIKASGFTFSSPTVRVKLTNPTTTTTTSTSTTATTTTAVPTTATATAPARPTGVTTKVASRRLTVSFRATSGVTYTVRATKGSATKRATCRKSGSMQICTTSSLAKGTWKVTVTPTRAGVAGTAWTKSVTVR